MRDHVAVKHWSERVEEQARPGSPPPGTFYQAHFIQCRCGLVFTDRRRATVRSLHRAHRVQVVAEENARSGFDAAAYRESHHVHGSDL